MGNRHFFGYGSHEPTLFWLRFVGTKTFFGNVGTFDSLFTLLPTGTLCWGDDRGDANRVPSVSVSLVPTGTMLIAPVSELKYESDV